MTRKQRKRGAPPAELLEAQARLAQWRRDEAAAFADWVEAEKTKDSIDDTEAIARWCEAHLREWHEGSDIRLVVRQAAMIRIGQERLRRHRQRIAQIDIQRGLTEGGRPTTADTGDRSKT